MAKKKRVISFLACALKSYNSPSPSEANLKPLLIVWRDPDTEKILPVPYGVFPLTIVHLMNQEEPQFRIPPPSDEYFKYRDAMSFRIRLCGNQIGTIHIINKYKHIEVYFDGDEPAKYCPSLRKLIREAVKCSIVLLLVLDSVIDLLLSALRRIKRNVIVLSQMKKKGKLNALFVLSQLLSKIKSTGN